MIEAEHVMSAIALAGLSVAHAFLNSDPPARPSASIKRQTFSVVAIVDDGKRVDISDLILHAARPIEIVIPIDRRRPSVLKEIRSRDADLGIFGREEYARVLLLSAYIEIWGQVTSYDLPRIREIMRALEVVRAGSQQVIEIAEEAKDNQTEIDAIRRERSLFDRARRAKLTQSERAKEDADLDLFDMVYS